MSERARQARLWAQKWRWYERNSLPWNRARIHWELAAARGVRALADRTATCWRRCARGAWRSARSALLEPGVWLTAPAPARMRIGGGTFLNMGVMVAADRAGRDRRALHARQRLLRHRRQPPLRRPRASRCRGRASRPRARRASATTSGCGANVVVTSGVTIGERCVIGANCVVTERHPRVHDRRRARRRACSSEIDYAAEERAAPVKSKRARSSLRARRLAVPDGARRGRDERLDLAARRRLRHDRHDDPGRHHALRARDGGAVHDRRQARRHPRAPARVRDRPRDLRRRLAADGAVVVGRRRSRSAGRSSRGSAPRSCCRRSPRSSPATSRASERAAAYGVLGGVAGRGDRRRPDPRRLG